MSELRDLMSRAVRNVHASADALASTELKIQERQARRRRGGLLVGFGTFAGCLALLGLAFAGRIWTASEPGSVGSPSAPTAPDLHSSIPNAYMQGDQTIAPIVFPNGTALEFAFPTELGLGEDGVRASTAGGLEQVDRTIEIYPAPPEEIPVLGDEVIEEYPGAQGESIKLWEGSPAGALRYLVYEFGSWTVLVYDSGDLSDEERRTWAMNLVGHEDGGFLVLDATAPLVLEQSGNGDGPQVWLSGPEERQEVGLFPSICTPDDPQEVQVSEVGETGWFASWCEPNGRARVHAYGGSDEAFVFAVLSSTSVQEF